MSRNIYIIFLASIFSFVFFFSFFQSSQAGFFDWFKKFRKNDSQSAAEVVSRVQQDAFYTVSVSKSGSGGVTSDDGKINCGEQCKVSYPANSKIVLKAEAGNNYKFERWNGCDKVSDGNCQTTLNKSKMIVAKFSSKKPSPSTKSSSSPVGKASSIKSSSSASSKSSSSKSFSSSSSLASKSSSSVSSQQTQNSNTSSSSTPTLTPITKNGFLLSGTFCTIDYTLVPQSEVNARKLLSLCEIDIPKLEARFGRGPKAPPYRIKFYTPRVGDSGNAVARAYASDGIVVLSTDFSTDEWKTDFPWDAGVTLAHELAHVIQSFYGPSTQEYVGWLVEALADYGAYVAGYSNDLEKNCYHFPRPRQINVFNCTYEFLKFIGNKYDPEIPFKLTKALQSGTYSDNLFIQYTGKTYDQLISECSQYLDCGGVDSI